MKDKQFLQSLVWSLTISFCCRRAAKGIEELCNQIMAEYWKSEAYTWLFAVPLLHFLRGDSKPFEEPVIEGSCHKLDWFGAQGLNIKEFQRSAENL